MTDPTGTDAAKPATVFVTTTAGMVSDQPTGTDGAAPATRFVLVGSDGMNDRARPRTCPPSGSTTSAGDRGGCSPPAP